MGTKGRALLLSGGAAMILAVAVAVGSLLVGRSLADDAVRSLVRAPTGCDTAIRFDRTATVDVWIETRGSLDGVPGSCGADVAYDHGTAAVPQVLVTVVDVEDGSTLRLQRTTTVGYDRAGFRGSRFRTLEATADQSVVVRVEGVAADQVVVAFGPDPSDAGRSVILGGLAVAVVALVTGVGLVIGGIVRRFAGYPVPSAPPGPTGASTAGATAGSRSATLPAPESPPTWSPPPPPGRSTPNEGTGTMSTDA